MKLVEKRAEGLPDSHACLQIEGEGYDSLCGFLDVSTPQGPAQAHALLLVQATKLHAALEAWLAEQGVKP